MAITGEGLQRFFKRQNSRFGKCLEPTLTCKNKAIRAHSIQNANVFDLVSTHDHVSMLKARFSKEGPFIDFVEIGRNEASTFLGFCSQHDAEIFRPLDTRPLDISNDEQLFLLAYRSVSRELHATMDAAIKIQRAYLDRVARGLDAADSSSQAGMQAVTKMIVSYETHAYRARNYDENLAKRNFGGVLHDVIRLPNQLPCLAASCLFSLDEIRMGDEVARAALNVLPLNHTESVAVFSYGAKEASLARIALSRIIEGDGFQQKYELSKLIIERTENFALSPAHVRSWTRAKTDAVKKAFARTMFFNGIEDDVNLMLF